MEENIIQNTNSQVLDNKFKNIDIKPKDLQLEKIKKSIEKYLKEDEGFNKIE